jgi:hypothetical protein
MKQWNKAVDQYVTEKQKHSVHADDGNTTFLRGIGSHKSHTA